MAIKCVSEEEYHNDVKHNSFRVGILPCGFHKKISSCLLCCMALVEGVVFLARESVMATLQGARLRICGCP